jgi:hypothetical protein
VRLQRRPLPYVRCSTATAISKSWCGLGRNILPARLRGRSARLPFTVWATFIQAKDFKAPERGFAIDRFNENNFYERGYERISKLWCMVNRKLKKRGLSPVLIGHVQLPRLKNQDGNWMGTRSCVEQYATMIGYPDNPIITIYDGFERWSVGARTPIVTEFSMDKMTGQRKPTASTHTSYFDAINYNAWRKQFRNVMAKLRSARK